MGDEKSFEDNRKMYTGKELADCFANLNMTINNEIRTVKQEIKETNERVGVLESHAELVNDLIKTVNEETVPNLEDKLNEEAKGLLYNVGARDVCILSITTVLAKLSA